MIDLPAIRRTLCTFVTEPDAIRRVCNDALAHRVAGIDARLDWTGPVVEIWGRALRELERHTGAIEALVETVRRDYADAFPDGIPRRAPKPSPSGAPRVAVVGVVAELGGTLDAIAARLADLPGLAITIADAAGAAPAADFVIAVIGARTGGTSTLADATARAGLVLLWQGARLEKAPADEAIAALTLRRHPGAVDFDTPRAAADRALEAVHPFWQARRPPALAAEDAVDPPRLRTWERAWLAVRVERWRVGRYSPLASRNRRHRLERAAIYVPLHADPLDARLDADGGLTLPEPCDPRESDGMAAMPGRRGAGDEPTPAPLEAVASAAALPHLVIEGAPGAGKTVLLQHIAYTLAALHRDETPPRHRLDLDALRGGALRWPVPLLIEASALAACRGLGDLTDRLTAAIQAAVDQPVPADEVRAGLARGRYLVLIDALDEVGGQSARDRLADHLAGWGRTDRRARVVLTTRPSAWRGSTAFPRPLRLVRAAPMSVPEADALVDRWAEAQAFDAPWSAGAKAALADLAARHGGMDPRQNPLLLVCALVVYGGHGGLPESPARLYDRIVDILCETRATQASEIELRQSLEALFFALQARGGARTATPVAEAARALHRAMPKRYPTVDAARDALDLLYESTGLVQFEEAGSRTVVRAWHRSFQEYFAARALADCGDAVEKTTARLVADGRAADPEWEGVMRFVAGLHANRGDCAARHVETLHAAAQGHPRRGRLLGLAATALREYREAFPGHALYDALPGEVIEAFEADGIDWPLADRLLALEAVGALGDPRLDRPMLVAVAGGAFTMGGDERAFQSAPAHRVRVGDFYAGWRPVTVADFAPFVERGWGDDRWWPEGQREAEASPRDWLLQLHHRSRPVVGVSWFAARAFCAWATAEGRAAAWGGPDDGVIDLPSEAEWEWLARGSDGRVFPWGDAPPGDGDAARAAYSPGRHVEDELTLDAATPVGAFPAGSRGPFVDLAGNVWEWCLDAWREPSDDSWRSSPGDGSAYAGHLSALRVLRGGAWFDPSLFLRAASRLGDDPRSRLGDFGFRVVCRVSREHG